MLKMNRDMHNVDIVEGSDLMRRSTNLNRKDQDNE